MIANALGRFAYRRFLAATRDPFRAQVRRLRTILDGAAASEFGQEHDFRRLARIADPLELVGAYQRQVPIRNWASMRSDLEAVYRGRWQRLCPSPPLWFAMTAGSTGEYKYVPVTPEYRREVGQSSLIFQGAVHASFPAVRRSRTQFLVGSAEGGLSPGGVPQGFASGFNYKNLPRLLRRRFVVPYWVFTLDDPDERAYAAGRILVDQPALGVLCAISPVNLINLRRTLDRNAERLIGDVESGTLTLHGQSAVPGTWRGKPSPSRARALRDAWLATGALPTPALFPGLRVLVCWQGGNMGYYLDELRAAFGIDRTFEFPISASEGVFAIPFRPDRPGGILAVTSHFLEFVPEDAGRAGTPVLRADQLEEGQEYGLMVTNAGGLYRYDMEDIVRVTGHHHATPIIEFVSKKSRQVSVSNERLTELDVTHAMLEASRRCHRWFDEFLFVPCSDRRYRVMLDGASAGCEDRVGPDGPLRGLAAELDRQLRNASKGYDFEREDGLLDPLQVLVTAPGQLRSWLNARQSELRLPNAQVKPMHLTNEFDAHQRFTTGEAYAA
jgi:hypothetical protein